MPYVANRNNCVSPYISELSAFPIAFSDYSWSIIRKISFLDLFSSFDSFS